MNDLIREEEINVDGKMMKLKVVVGGDMKFMLIVLGMNAAHSTYACIWCEIHKDKRFCSVNDMYYNNLFIFVDGKWMLMRTITMVKTCAR